jgi:hypothetical protein
MYVLVLYIYLSECFYKSYYGQGMSHNKEKTASYSERENKIHILTLLREHGKVSKLSAYNKKENYNVFVIYVILLLEKCRGE